MSRETTGASGFTSRSLKFRLWAGIAFVVIVAGLLAYVLPSPAQWRHSISTFVASLPGYRDEPSQQQSESGNVVWMSTAPAKPQAPVSGAPVALALSGVKEAYSLRETIDLQVRNAEASGVAWYSCRIEQRSPQGWRELTPPPESPPSTCTSRVSPLRAGQALNIAWSPSAGKDAAMKLKPAEYRFAVRAHWEMDAPGETWIEFHSEPFVIK